MVLTIDTAQILPGFPTQELLDAEVPDHRSVALREVDVMLTCMEFRSQVSVASSGAFGTPLRSLGEGIPPHHIR
jgi:hypothetical protein